MVSKHIRIGRQRRRTREGRHIYKIWPRAREHRKETYRWRCDAISCIARLCHLQDILYQGHRPPHHFGHEELDTLLLADEICCRVLVNYPTIAKILGCETISDKSCHNVGSARVSKTLGIDGEFGTHICMVLSSIERW